MFVRLRTWNDKNDRYYNGKAHWMKRPWVTECGIDMGPDWDLDIPWQRNWIDGCKRCGLG